LAFHSRAALCHSLFSAVRGFAVIITISVLMIPVSLGAATINVPASQPTIQAGVNAASSGDTVLVAPGTYMGAGNFDIDTGGKNITITSSGGAAVTIIDMTGASSSSPKHAFDIHRAETVTISGFTLKNGYFENGAITVSDSTATITQCIFTGNKSVAYGGALTIIENNLSVTVTVQQSQFINNTAGDLTANSGLGGAIEVLVNSPSNSETVNIVNSTFAGNTATYDGGAIDITGLGSSPAVTITNSSFSGNNANGFVATGSGLPASGTGHVPGAIDSFQGTVTIKNSILWGDNATEYSTLNDPATSGGGSASITNSDVQGGFSGTGNFNVDPIYVNQAGADLRLAYNSPVIHAGTSTGAPGVDLLGNPRGSNPDQGAYQYTVTTTASNIAATPAIAFSGQVATFADFSGDIAPLSAFSGVIVWGDATMSAVTISQPGGSGTPYVVSGVHTYAQAGAYAFSLTITALTNAPQVTASGSGTATVTAIPTATLVSPSAGTIVFGTPETFTATVTSNGGVVTAGSVTFTDITTATTLAGNVALNTSGQASTPPVTLAAGTHTIQAAYNPDLSHGASSNTTIVTVTAKKRRGQITSQ
jgi:predicted outer membrane repeat protein